MHGQADRVESRPGIPVERPDSQRVESFQQIVRRSIPCFVRKPRGLDIYAACRQLKRTTELVSLSPLAPAAI
jgi:23S rRNA (adenine2503-C2)-methyltransferase